jgi:hypothetical protein
MKKYIQCVAAIFLLMSGANKINAQYQNTTIYTPANTSVIAGRFIGTDYTSAQKNDAKNYWLSIYNNRIKYQDEATYKYNCHAYAWHISENGSQVWINTPEQKKYWNDNSYTEVLNPAVATKVSFGGPCYSQNSYVDECDHSAVTTSTPDYFISKWGPSPLFRHHKNDCPYSVEDLHYYSRPSISGPTLFLNAGSTYTLNLNGHTGGTVIWTYSPKLQKLSSSNTSITVKPYGNGLGWIEASVGGVSTPRREIWVGKPVISEIIGNRDVPAIQDARFVAKWDSRADIISNSFQWILNPLNRNRLYDYDDGFLYIAFYNTGNYQLVVRAANVNGLGDYYVTNVNVHDPSSYSSSSSSSSSFLYRISQDSASNELTITPDTSVSQLSPLLPSSGAAVNYTVYLYNAGGAVVKQAASPQGGEVQLDVSGLPNGIYYLLIDAGNGTKPKSHKIIINH